MCLLQPQLALRIRDSPTCTCHVYPPTRGTMVAGRTPGTRVSAPPDSIGNRRSSLRKPRLPLDIRIEVGAGCQERQGANRGAVPNTPPQPLQGFGLRAEGPECKHVPSTF